MWDQKYSYAENIRRDLLQKILGGELEIGARVPSEKELERKYSVSRTPVRQAMSRLADDGLVVRLPGRGTFVSRVHSGSPQARLSSFSYYYETSYDRISARTIDIEDVLPDRDVAETLGLGAKEMAHRIRRLRYFEGIPVAYLTFWLPSRFRMEPLLKEPEFMSIRGILLAEFGVRCSQAKEILDAIMPTEEERALLRITELCPVLQVRKVVYDETGAVVLVNKHIVNSAIWKYRTTLLL